MEKEKLLKLFFLIIFQVFNYLSWVLCIITILLYLYQWNLLLPVNLFSLSTGALIQIRKKQMLPTPIIVSFVQHGRVNSKNDNTSTMIEIKAHLNCVLHGILRHIFSKGKNIFIARPVNNAIRILLIMLFPCSSPKITTSFSSFESHSQSFTNASVYVLFIFFNFFCYFLHFPSIYQIHRMLALYLFSINCFKF